MKLYIFARYIFASKSNADCFGSGVGNTHTMKHSVFLTEHCTDRNQITHPHFTIFAPICPGHLYFHSILKSRMKENNMIAVKQVMPSSVSPRTSVSFWCSAQTHIIKIFSSIRIYFSNVSSAFIWKHPQKHTKSPSSYKRIKSVYRLHHHILLCNIPLLWTSPCETAPVIPTVFAYLFT